MPREMPTTEAKLVTMLREAAAKAWEEAYETGRQHGLLKSCIESRKQEAAQWAAEEYPLPTRRRVVTIGDVTYRVDPDNPDRVQCLSGKADWSRMYSRRTVDDLRELAKELLDLLDHPDEEDV